MSTGRISTSMFFQNSSNQITNTNGKLYNLQNQLSTGKKINNPSDNPLGAAQASVAKDLKSQNDSYFSAVTTAQNSITNVTSEATRVINTLQSLNELAVQSRNGSLTRGDLKAIGANARALVNNLVDAANAQDGTGNFVFSGSNVTSKPFQFNGTQYLYTGDQTNGYSKVGPSDVVQTSWNGDHIFMSSLTGDGNVNASASLSNQGNVFVSDIRANSSTSYNGDTYTLSFSLSSANIPQFTVTDSLGTTVLPTQNYLDGQGISFSGIYLELSGTPKSGDVVSILPSQKFNLLDSAEKFASLLENADQYTTGALSDGLASIQRQFTSASDTINSQQALMGAQLKALDIRTQTINSVSDSLEAFRSNIEDADYAQVITQYQQQKTALEASLQSFSKISSLNLFNFLR